MYRTLITTSALASHLDDPEWVLVDCRYDLTNETWGVNQYRAAHLPGAVYASLARDLSGDKEPGTGRHPLPSPNAMAATFGSWGITTTTQVACYDQDSGMYAARLWWMLRYMGHEAVGVLDGGFAKWLHESRPTRGGDEHRRHAVFDGSPHDAMRLTVDDVSRALGSTSMVLVDARAAERYEGRNEPLDRVAGHIPGARNYFFKRNLASDGTMLPPDQLRAQLAEILDGTLPTQATMYCGSGVTACHNLLALEHAGLGGAKLYVGSWSEWSSDPQRPVETGPRHPS
jgi:thiosulfate/3-mercaptopyruvate sulfurtransferase